MANISREYGKNEKNRPYVYYTGENGQRYRHVDLSNERFGKLVAIKRNSVSKVNRQVFWECVCDCGVVKNIRGSSLVRRYTVSCGCYGAKQRSIAKTTHGKSNTPLYYIWRGVINRCYGNEKKYEKSYKGKVFVCDRWIKSFQNFYDDLHSTYEKGLQLDRINNNGNYESSNCRWATPVVQSNNKSNNRRFKINGKEYSAKEIEDIYGVNKTTFLSRINRGQSVEKALAIPFATTLSEISQYLVF